MDIFLGVTGVIIILLLAIVILLLMRKSGRAEQSDSFKEMDERLIRVEGEVSKINPAIDRNFRENRKEIADNLTRLQSGNEKKLDEIRETVCDSKDLVRNRKQTSFVKPLSLWIGVSS